MWKAIRQKILQVNEASGIEIVFRPEQQCIVNYVTVKNRDGQIAKQSFNAGLKGLNELKDANKKLPVSLVLNGKGILTRKCRLQGEENPILLVFPQANPAEFYCQVLHCGGNDFVSIARRPLVEETIANVEQAGFRVLDVSLGFSAMEPVLLFAEQDSLNTVCYQLKMGQGSIIDFELRTPGDDDLTNRDEYLISRQYIRPYELLAFAAGTGLLISGAEGAAYIAGETLNKQRENFLHQRYFKAASRSLLLLIFLVLLVNFFVYDHYYEKNSHYASSAGMAVPRQDLSNGVRNKEQFLQSHGWLQPQRSSFFADRFAGFLPEGIWLSSLQFNPVNASQGMLSFRTDTIQLNGACNDPERINLLINNIKTMKEVKQVVMKNYTYKKEEDIGAFSIDIITK
jgi:hypothetical protein